MTVSCFFLMYQNRLLTYYYCVIVALGLLGWAWSGVLSTGSCPGQVPFPTGIPPEPHSEKSSDSETQQRVLIQFPTKCRKGGDRSHQHWCPQTRGSVDLRPARTFRNRHLKAGHEWDVGGRCQTLGWDTAQPLQGLIEAVLGADIRSSSHEYRKLSNRVSYGGRYEHKFAESRCIHVRACFFPLAVALENSSGLCRTCPGFSDFSSPHPETPPAALQAIQPVSQCLSLLCVPVPEKATAAGEPWCTYQAMESLTSITVTDFPSLFFWCIHFRLEPMLSVH